MPYKNPIELLIGASQLPAAIEAKLPEGAPKLSTALVNIANTLPVLPDFPVEIPDLPAVPELPAFPAGPAELRRRIVTGVEVRPVTASPTPAAVLGARRPEEEVVRIITP